MKRSLAIVAFLFAGGVLIGQYVQPPLEVLFTVSFAIGLISLAWPRARPILLCALLPLAGWTDQAAHVLPVSPLDLRNLLPPAAEEITVRGRICTPPNARIFLHGAGEIPHSSALMDVHSIARGVNWSPALGRIVAGCSGLLDSNYFAGQEVIVRGVIAQPPGPFAPGLFDARYFYASEGVYFQLRSESTNDWQTVPGGASRLAVLGERFQLWARATLGRGLPVQDEPLDLLRALALDWREPLTPEVEQPFLRAGTYHIFAVDGLRIGILTGICLALLRVFRVPRAWCGATAIPLAWAYTAFTTWPASAVRASIMMTILILGWAIRRPGDILNSLCAAAFIILCWDPRQLFQPGFQFSFVIVFCLALLLPPLRAWAYQRILQGDPFLPDHLRRRWPEWLWRSVKYIIDLLLISWIAWLASIPLAAFYFHLFTPWSVPANFLVVPATALALAAAAASLACAPWLPALSILFNHSAWFWMKSIIVATQCWASWRPGSFNIAAPSLVTLVWYYAVLLSLGGGWIFRARRKRPAWSVLAGATALAAACAFYQRGITNLYVLPARGGSVVFLDGSSLLLDSGSASFAETVLTPFLQAQGVNHLAQFCLTSAHLEQTGGASLIRSNFITSRYAPVGQEHAGDDVLGWRVCHPNAGESHPRADDNALVLRKSLGPWNVLLLSRLGREGQNALLQRGQNLRSDLVIAALPAGDEPLSDPFLDALAPQAVIIVDSNLPATRRASSSLRARLARRGIKIFYCSDSGALSVRARGRSLEITDPSDVVLLALN